jgi:L-ascorbate metabolism protein UlaG (beta-lactamase superfamily)
MTQKVFFRSDVAFEPRVNSWYAWPFLIYPPTLGMITKNNHIKLLESFIKSPQVHINASRDPSLIGGPFINYHGAVANVERFTQNSKDGLADLIALGARLFEFHERLCLLDGTSVEPLYAELPAELKGITELAYDIKNRPSLRLIEALVYLKYSTDKHQGLRLIKSDMNNRPFALSTPCFEGDAGLNLKLPFASKEVDFLMEAKYAGIDFDVLFERIKHLANGACSAAQLLEMTTEKPFIAAEDAQFDGDGLRLRYFGHASVLIQSRNVSIMVDPFISSSDAGGIPRFSDLDLPEHIDYVLLTHNHSDHVLFETLLQIRCKIGAIVVPKVSGNGITDPSLKLILLHCGFPNVIELGEMETIPLATGEITAIPFIGEHGDMNIVGKLGYSIRDGGASAMFLADSNNLDTDMYRYTAKQLGKIDSIFIGMECKGAPMSWLYGSFLTKSLTRSHDQSRRLNGSDCQRAIDLVDCFSPSSVFVYAMGSEPALRFISSIAYTQESEPIVESNLLVSKMRERGIFSERLFGKREILISNGVTKTVGDTVPEPF